MSVDGTEVVRAQSFDEDREDTFGIYWIGSIDADAEMLVQVLGPEGINNAIRAKSAFVSYKIYAPGFPVKSALPDPCGGGS